jgi:hypothetical protein
MFLIDAPDVTIGQHKGVAHIVFDQDHKLNEVNLDFTLYEDKPKCFDRISDQDAASRVVIITDISKTILERYGAPASESGRLPTRQELASYYSLGGRAKSVLAILLRASGTGEGTDR